MTASSPAGSPLLALLTAAGRVRSLATAVLQEAGLTLEQFAVYESLGERGPLSPTELAQELGHTLEGTLEVIRELLERGHLGRLRQPAGSRPGLLQLTPAGREAWAPGRRAWGRLETGLAENLVDPKRVSVALQDLGTAVLDTAGKEKLPPN